MQLAQVLEAEAVTDEAVLVRNADTNAITQDNSNPTTSGDTAIPDSQAPQTAFCDTIFEYAANTSKLKLSKGCKSWTNKDGATVNYGWIEMRNEHGSPLIFSLRDEKDDQTTLFKVPFGLDLNGMYNADSKTKTTTLNITPKVVKALDELQHSVHQFIFDNRIGKKAKHAESVDDIKRHCPCAFYRRDQSGNHASIRVRLPTLPSNSASTSRIDDTLLVIEDSLGNDKTVQATQDSKFFVKDAALEIKHVSFPTDRSGFNVVYQLRYLEYAGTNQEPTLPPLGTNTVTMTFSRACDMITLGELQTKRWTPREGLGQNVNHSLPIGDKDGNPIFIELGTPSLRFPIMHDSNNGLFSLSEADVGGANELATLVRQQLYQRKEKLAKSFIENGVDYGPFWPCQNIESVDDMRFAGPDVLDSEWGSFRGLLPMRYDSLSKKRIIDTAGFLVRDAEGRPFPIANINRDTKISTMVVMPLQVTLPASESSRIQIKFIMRRMIIGESAPRRIAPKRRMDTQGGTPKRVMC